MNILKKFYQIASSAGLALALLVMILISCLAGALFLPDLVARRVIFSSFWFNGLLTALVLNTAFCFFPRMWRRKPTLVSSGLIVFHLSFILIFAGVVYDSLFYFRGEIRLTEGESLNIAEPQNYDFAEFGRFLDPEAVLKGMITFHKFEPRYMVEGDNKGPANDISTEEGGKVKRDFIYATRHLNFKGLKFYRNKDGFSPLIVMRDVSGNVVYGAYAPIQSLRRTEKTYFYTTGTAKGPGPMQFPQSPEKPLFNLQFEYHPDPKKDREGGVFFQVWPYAEHGAQQEKELFKGKAAFGEKVQAGDYQLSMEEVRFWAGMTVRYNPGQPLILASFWIGLGGITLTMLARLRRKRE